MVRGERKMRKNIVSVGLLVSLLSVGVLTSNVREERNTLEVRDVLVEDFTNEASGRLVRRANEVAENNLSDVKAQISSVNDNGTRHIRFVAALDSYLYENVAFTITANNGEETRTLVNNEVVTTAYTHLVAAGETLSASDAFGEGYTYLVAYTINNVPESAWGFSFSATVSARAEGYSEDVVSSATRVISDMAANEDEMVKETPTVVFDETVKIYEGEISNLFDKDASTYVWFEGVPSYVDFDFGSEIALSSLEIVFQAPNGEDATLNNISYFDNETNEYVSLGNIESYYWSLALNTNLDSIKTSKIRLSESRGGQWLCIREFRYNASQLTLNGVGKYYEGTELSLFDDDQSTSLWLDAAPSVNAYIDIDLGETTQLKSLYIDIFNDISGLPRVQYLDENGEFVTLTEKASSGYNVDLRSENIYTKCIRLTTRQDQGYDQWIHYNDIIINGISDDTPILTLEGSCTEIYEGNSINVFDGDDSTYIWNNGPVMAGDAYVITYPKPFDLKNLYVFYRSGIEGEVTSYDKIAYRTTTNNEWVDLDVTFEDGQMDLFLDLSDNIIEDVTQIKLYTSRDLGVWGGIATFDVNYGATSTDGMKEYLPSTSTFEAFNESSFVSKVFDRNSSTYFAYGHGIDENQELVIDLGQIRHLRQIEILFQHLDWSIEEAAYFPYLEYSVDGVNYSEKITIEGNEFSHVFNKTAHVRYIRLSGSFEKWPSIVSVTLTSAY